MAFNTLSKLCLKLIQLPPLFMQSALVSIESINFLISPCENLFLSNIQLKNAPLKKFTPIIAKIKIKRLQMISPFIIEGMASNRDPTAILKASLLEMTLRILKARKDLNTFKDLNTLLKLLTDPSEKYSYII